jgi:hypothetical protein
MKPMAADRRNSRFPSSPFEAENDARPKPWRRLDGHVGSAPTIPGQKALQNFLASLWVGIEH